MDIRKKYLIHLLDRIFPEMSGGSDPTGLPFFNVLMTLNEIPFISLNERDESRVTNALEVRELLLEEDPELYEQVSLLPVSLLEIMVVLSRFMAFARDKMVRHSEPWRWLCELLGNMGVFETSSEWEVRRAGWRVVNREYEPNGENGLFPLNYSNVDQRDVELWMQMNAYLIQHYKA